MCVDYRIICTCDSIVRTSKLEPKIYKNCFLCNYFWIFLDEKAAEHALIA